MTGIVLQARMGSTRLPGKVLRRLQGRPMLAHILERLKAVSNAEMLVVATSARATDDPVAHLAREAGVAVFRGSEDDVLDRNYQAARHFGLTQIVRATADNPLVDPEETTRLIDFHRQGAYDLSHCLNQLPLGVGTECFRFAALQTAWENGHERHHREHVDEYLLERPDRFTIGIMPVPATKQASHLRLTVDTPDDFSRLEHIYEQLYRPGHLITTQEVVDLCGR